MPHLKKGLPGGLRFSRELRSDAQGNHVVHLQLDGQRESAAPLADVAGERPLAKYLAVAVDAANFDRNRHGVALFASLLQMCRSHKRVWHFFTVSLSGHSALLRVEICKRRAKEELVAV